MCAYTVLHRVMLQFCTSVRTVCLLHDSLGVFVVAAMASCTYDARKEGPQEVWLEVAICSQAIAGT